MNEVRIDKWMWATRIFKTRTIAAEACKKGRVMINGVTIKPSRMIKVGEIIQVRKPPITCSKRKTYGSKVSTGIFGKRNDTGPI